MLRAREWLIIRRGASDEILKKWLDTGLLIAIDSSKQRILAKLYEDISKVALGMAFKNPNTDTLILPIARYCYFQCNHYIRNIHKYCLYVDDNLQARQSPSDGISAYEKNTGKTYSREEKIESAKKIGRKDLPDDYLGIDIQAEVSLRIAHEVAAQKI